MSEHIDTDMGGVSLERQHAELANDASNVAVTSETEERAAKRLKKDDSTPSQTGAVVETTVPGEGLHEAPSEKENVNPQNGEAAKSVPEASRPEHVDGRVNGIAKIKKE